MSPPFTATEISGVIFNRGFLSIVKKKKTSLPAANVAALQSCRLFAKSFIHTAGRTAPGNSNWLSGLQLGAEGVS